MGSLIHISYQMPMPLGAFLRVDRLAAPILLVQANVENIALAEDVDEERSQSEFGGEEVQARLIEDVNDFPDENIDAAGPLLDNHVHAEDPEDPQENGNANQHGEKSEDGRVQKNHRRPPGRSP